MQRTKEEIKEFCLSNIAPYFKDPSTCGYDGVSCVYLTSDGRMCILGKNMLNPPTGNNSGAADIVLRKEKEEDILKPEAIGMLSIKEWCLLQAIHDDIARKQPRYEIESDCDELGIFTYEEMEQYSTN